MRGARTVLAAVLAALLAQAAPVAAHVPPPEARAAKKAKPLLTTVADVRRQGPAVASSFLGFSHEYEGARNMIGIQKGQVNAVSVQLLRNLAAYGNGIPVLRIGGNSQDQAWWNPAGNPRPRSIQIDLGPSFFGKLDQFLATTGGRTIIGLNMAINDPAYPVELARNALAIVDSSRIEAFEVGNEPHVFPIRILELDEQGNVVYTRGKDYDHAQYMPELERHVDALRQLSPSPPLTAPGYCCEPWLAGLPTLLKRVGPKLELIALHRYPLESCGLEVGDPGYPTIGELLAERAIAPAAKDLFKAVNRAKAKGLGVRLTETNSATCGGARRVSNTFASALWLADWYFSLAAVGVQGADLHMSSPLYNAFQMGFFQSGRPKAEIHPTYFGMLLFAQATAHRSRVLPTTVFNTRRRAKSNVKVWGFVDKTDKVVRVAVINKHAFQGGRARIRIPFAARSAQARRLEAPKLTSVGNVSWAGQAFETPTLDGVIKGDEQVSTVRRGRRSTFSVDVPAASAVLLTVKVSRTR